MSANEIPVAEARSVRYFFKGQGMHLVLGTSLIFLAGTLVRPVLGDGSWLGIADVTWFWSAICLAVVHQVLVWIVFRGQLGWAVLTRLFGGADMVVWGLVFTPLLIARPILLLGLAVADHGSLALPRALAWIASVIFLFPCWYALYSVLRYFGFARALGGDHFRLAYREMPLVREGAFRWSRNAMYAFVFLGLWSIALISASAAALVLAIFQHAYVWVHYYATEKADMELLYDPRFRSTS